MMGLIAHKCRAIIYYNMVKESGDKPQAPKRPLSAFFLFRQDRYKDVTAANPNKNVADITKIISEEWKLLSDEKKKDYQNQYNASKTKYDQEIKDYTAKYGKVEKKKKIKREKKDKKEKKGKNDKGAAKQPERKNSSTKEGGDKKKDH